MPSFIEREQLREFDPYKTPIDQIANTFQTKVGYWAQGASQVKNTYQNFLNMELSLKDNQKALEGYMIDAKEKLKSLNRSDLSIGENISNIMGVFDPISKDESIRKDNYITKHYNAENERINSIKRTTPDKYGYKNDMLVKLNQRDFKNAKRGEEDMFLNNLKSYEDFTDVTKKVFERLKEFDPTVIKDYQLQNGAVITKETIAKLPNDVRAYVETFLDDKDRRQLEINGAVDFWNDRETLRAAYISDQNQRMGTVQEQISVLKNKFNTATPERKIEIEQELKAKALIQDGYKEVMTKLADNTYFNANYEKLAGDVSKSQFVNSITQGFSKTDKSSVGYALDSVWAFKQKQVFDNAESEAQRNHEKQLAMLRSQTTLEAAKISASAKSGKGSKDGSTDGDGEPLGATVTINAQEDVNFDPNAPLKSDVAYNESITNLQNSFKTLEDSLPELSDAMRNAGTDKERFEIGHALLSDHGAIKQKMVNEVASEVLNEYNNTAEGRKSPARDYKDIPNSFNRTEKWNKIWNNKVQMDSRFKSIQSFMDQYDDHMNLVNVRDQATKNITNKVLDRIKNDAYLEDVRLDRSGFNGEEKMSPKKYTEFITTLNNLEFVDASGKSVSLTPEQRKQIANRALQIIDRERNLNDNEVLNKAYTEITKSGVTKKRPNLSNLLNEFTPSSNREQKIIPREQFAQVIAENPDLAKYFTEDKVTGTKYLSGANQRILSSRFNSKGDFVDEKLNFKYNGKSLDVNDNSQNIYSVYRRNLDVENPIRNTRDWIQMKRVSPKHEYHSTWKQAAQNAAGKDAVISDIRMKEDGSIHYTLAGAEKQPIQLIPADETRAYNKYEGISPQVQKVWKNFEQGQNGTSTQQELGLSSNPFHRVQIISNGNPENPSFKLRIPDPSEGLSNGMPKKWRDAAQWDGQLTDMATLNNAIIQMAANPQSFLKQ